MIYIPIAGTWGEHAGWVCDDDDPWNVYMWDQGFRPLRRSDGSPWFNWPAKLAGLPFVRRKYWREWSESLATALAVLPYEQRNLIAHSHGGQLAILTAARGVPIRSLTTIATPRREDIPAELAVPHIGYWQHVHDTKRDWIATLPHPVRRTLGQFGDGSFSTERRFLIAGVQNIGLEGISHSELFSEPKQFHLWEDAGILDGIRFGPDKRVAS